MKLNLFQFTLAVIIALSIPNLSAQEPPKPSASSVPPPAPTSAAAPAIPPSPTPPVPAFAAPNLTPLGVRALTANCAACHGTNGNSVGGAITGLAGMDREYLISQMKLFKEGKRIATLMHQISKGYSDAEVAAMATYFAAQKK